MNVISPESVPFNMSSCIELLKLTLDWPNKKHRHEFRGEFDSYLRSKGFPPCFGLGYSGVSRSMFNLLRLQSPLVLNRVHHIIRDAIKDIQRKMAKGFKSYAERAFEAEI